MLLGLLLSEIISLGVCQVIKELFLDVLKVGSDPFYLPIYPLTYLQHDVNILGRYILEACY